MDGDSGDVDHLGDPLLCSIMSNLRSSPNVTGCVHTFVSSEGCHIIAESVLNNFGESLLDAGCHE